MLRIREPYIRRSHIKWAHDAWMGRTSKLYASAIKAKRSRMMVVQDLWRLLKGDWVRDRSYM